MRIEAQAAWLALAALLGACNRDRSAPRKVTPGPPEGQRVEIERVCIGASTMPGLIEILDAENAGDRANLERLRDRPGNADLFPGAVVLVRKSPVPGIDSVVLVSVQDGQDRDKGKLVYAMAECFEKRPK